MAQHDLSPFLDRPFSAPRPPARARRTLLSAASVVARRLSLLPPSPDVVKLRANVAEYMHEVEDGAAGRPANDHEPELRILALHVEVAKIESSRE